MGYMHFDINSKRGYVVLRSCQSTLVFLGIILILVTPVHSRVGPEGRIRVLCLGDVILGGWYLQ